PRRLEEEEARLSRRARHALRLHGQEGRRGEGGPLRRLRQRDGRDPPPAPAALREVQARARGGPHGVLHGRTDGLGRWPAVARLVAEGVEREEDEGGSWSRGARRPGLLIGRRFVRDAAGTAATASIASGSLRTSANAVATAPTATRSALAQICTTWGVT